MNIKTIKQQLTAMKSNVLLITVIVFSGAVEAVNIAQQPLFLTRAATPNIMFIMDDSGSMDWDILTVPHFEASNYDRDFDRSWARGGWLNWDHRNKAKRSSGDWVSYAGYCNDKNADGICYNRHDLDDDGDTTDYEKAGNIFQAANPNWRLRLDHLYYWEYVNGYCWEPSAGSSNAMDYLPAFDRVLSFLTGSSTAQAHTYNGTSWGGSNDPGNGSFTATDAAYASERWRHRGDNYDVGDWANNPAQAAAKTTCLATPGNQWKRSNTGKILHHGNDLHAGSRTATYPTWDSIAWAAPASTIDSNTGVLTRGAGGTDGGYHSEYTTNDGTAAVAATGSLDINGDGLFNTPDYYERDDWGVKRVNYRYLDESIDNVYLNPKGPFGDGLKPWETCSQSDLDSSANSCSHLQWSDYPNNYAYDVTNSNIAATSPWLTGNENIVTLPDTVKRAVKSSWITPTPPSDVVFTSGSIPWAGGTSPAGTHHAMNKWDKWPLISDWRIRSASLNVLYYSPTTGYKPWPGLVEGSFNAAKSNPQPGSTGYGATINLVRPHAATPLVTTAGVPYQHATEAGFVYEIWHDDAGFWSHSPQWNSSTTCGIATASTGNDVNGWKATYFDGRYGATVRSTVLGTVDPATGHVVVAGDRVCSRYNNEPNGIVDLWDKHDRVTVYTDKIVVETVRRTPHIMGERYNTDATKKVLVSDTRILNRVIYNAGTTYAVDGFCETVLGKDPANTANCRTVAQVQQNVANWYEFSRRRSFVAKGAIAQLIQTLPDLNYGLMGTSRDDTVSNNKTNDTDLSVDISKLFRDVYDGTGSGNGDADAATHNAALQTSMYDHVFRRSGTPLRQALQRAGEYFAGRGPVLGAANSVDDHSTSPITSECQKNFAIMLTDGYWSGLIPTDVLGVDGSGAAVALNNADGDGYTRTLADVAKYYYDEDLDTSLNNEVPTDSFDTNDAQHLTTIGIGFGVTGNLVDGNSNGWPGSVVGGSSLTESSDWGNPNNNPRKIDDLWHAAYNSRGLYFSAKNPDELIQRLNEAVLFATATVGSASAVTANSHVLTASTRIYQTTFKSGEWSGDVQSFGLTANGLVVQPAQWSAKALLDGVTANSRKIITLGLDGSGNDEGIPFRWADLVDASAATATVPDQQQALRTRWSSGVVESVAFGQDQLNYIRGATDAQFRDRSGHKLGDIVHSEPLYVGPPAQIYSDSLEAVAYSGFRSTHSGRDAMLYVGANDGMLHAFDASDGSEKFAYIPRVLIPSLNQLSHKNTPTRAFSHRYFVDDTPVSNDVFFAGAWHTVLVGGLRGGGKGIYALDVTTIPLDAEASAGSLDDVALWEFTDANDVDMGYSFSKPSIVRLNNGNWAAIFGNGYDSANGKAVLYIVEFNSDTEYGTVHKFDTGIGSAGTPNGLSTPTVIDTDGDMIADRVYAGDLLGNVWSFDISDNNDGNWALSYGAASPLFTATNDAAGLQPITAPISVEVHPSGAIAGYLLHFGTGKFFSSTDNDEVGQQTQSIYALWDYGSAGITRADLWKHEIVAEVTHAGTGNELRVTSDDSVPSTRNANPFSWISTGQIGDVGWQSNVDRKGWRMDLINVEGGNTDNHGERIVSPVVFHGDSVIYSTLLPGGDPCEGGGSGWLMTLNSATGARFAQTPFDINADGTFNSSDFAAWGGGTGTAASGVKSAAGIPSVPIILNTVGGQAVVISDHSTGELPEDENGTAIGGNNTGPNQPSFGQGGGLVNGATSLGRKSWIELD